MSAQTITVIDQHTQQAQSDIEALVKAARIMLKQGAEPSAVAGVLDSIKHCADTLANEVNALAESVGANCT